jgi:hypothetical protein
LPLPSFHLDPKASIDRITIMATVKGSIKESLVGTTQEPQLSQQIRQNFMRKAKTDRESGELYMGEDEFVDAIAPESEDYVSPPASSSEHPHPRRSWT